MIRFINGRTIEVSVVLAIVGTLGGLVTMGVLHVRKAAERTSDL
jgi:hypothetical protein